MGDSDGEWDGDEYSSSLSILSIMVEVLLIERVLRPK